MKDILQEAYELKREIIGEGSHLKKELRVLGRIVSYREGGITLEPDPQHLDVALHELELVGCRGVASPGARDVSERSAESLRQIRLGLLKSTVADQSDSSPPLDPDMAKRYVSVAARLNYLAMDRGDIAFSVKELMRFISSPCENNLIALKRVARYLVTAPRLVQWYKWGPMGDSIDIYVDANWAGCLKTRKSTIGGAILWGAKYIKGWAKTMPVLALSTGESELAAVTKGISEALGCQSLLSDFGHDVSINIFSDATAAISICRRQGLAPGNR